MVGESHAQFDTVASPTDNLTPWVYYSSGNAAPTTDVALHFAVGSSVTSGRVEVRVTDKGAGVHNAGDLLASAGDFRIDSSGALVQAGGSFAMPLDWTIMATLGLAMMVIFGHIRFALFRRLQRAVAASDWPAGGKALGSIRSWVGVNLALGVVIVVVTLLV